jgi:hypothetical protein
MRKNRFTRAISKIILKDLKPDSGLLLGAGFIQDGLDFKMGTLTVFCDDKKYYYFDLKGEKVLIKNMQVVSDLVYGNIQFLEV